MPSLSILIILIKSSLMQKARDLTKATGPFVSSLAVLVIYIFLNQAKTPTVVDLTTLKKTPIYYKKQLPF
jgi:hypothetical protein